MPATLISADFLLPIDIMKTFDLSNVVSLLNRLLEARLLGVTRYTHYALMVSGTERITMANFFTAQASECLFQAQSIGKVLIAFNERPSLSHQHFQEPSGQSLREMLLRTLHCERQVLEMYQALQQDRCASSNCLKSLASDMASKQVLSIEQLQLMLNAQEQPARVNHFVAARV